MTRSLIVASCLVAMSVAAADERPNFVLILCDDMGFSDIGCTGSEIETPNIDRLAAEGQLWTQFYNNAKCTTTRATLITGLYPRRPTPHLRKKMVTIPEALARGGYVSHMAGKWHLGSQSPNQPTDRGFDSFYGLLDGCCNFFDPSIPDPPFKGSRVRWFGENTGGGSVRISDFPEDFFTTDAFTDSAIEFVTKAAQSKKPFFLNLNYTAPHYPLHAPAEDVAKYRGRYRAGWDVLRTQRFARQQELGLFDKIKEPAPANRDTPDWDALSADEQDYHDHLMAVYAAMVDRMDRQIGRLIDALEAANVADDTLVMFLSDNGGCAETPGGIKLDRTPGVAEFYTACGPGWATAQNTPFRRYKQWVHEGGISTPFVVRWPAKVSPGSRVGSVGHIVDLQATILDAASVEHPTVIDEREIIPLEGISLLGPMTIQNGELTRPVPAREIFWEWNKSRAVREGDWKLVRDRGKPNWELYRINEDRTEQHDLAAEQPQRVAEMEAAWLAWAKRTGVSTSTSKSKKKSQR